MASVRSVLYVDDEPALCKAFERALRGIELRVTTTTSAHEAVRMLIDGSFDVVASDYRMPELDGLGVLRAAAERLPTASRILVSGGTDSGLDEPNVIGTIVHEIVPKPWSLDDLRRVIRRAADHSVVKREALVLGALVEALPQKITGVLEQLLGLRDPDTLQHSRRVARYARELAGVLAVPNAEVIERGALLHDIGKLGVSDEVLRKPGSFDEKDWVMMRRHPGDGAALLACFDFLEPVRLIVLQHHERWSGDGYPAGISGEQIVLGARITAVADSYDAMRSDRPYRKACEHALAMEELVRCSGTQFDPAVVEAFGRISEESLLNIQR